jgi:predicted nuclease with TOPRIM domain
MDWTTLLVTLLTVTTSASAWQFWQSRMKQRERADRLERADANLYRDDLRERVAVLEAQLKESQQDKEQMAQQIAELMAKVSEYRVRIEHLETENADLRKP